MDRILDPVCQGVLFKVLNGGKKRRPSERPSIGETLFTHLIISADGSDVNDGVGVVKERRPCVSLPTRATDVVQPPLDSTIVMLNYEGVLRNANGLDPRVKDVVDGWHVSLFSNPRDLIKETKEYEAGSVCGGDGHGFRPPRIRK